MGEWDDVAEAMQEQKPEPRPKPVTRTTVPKANVYTVLRDLTGTDVCALFGSHKVGKTKLCIEAAVSAGKMGKSVLYVDTECNISDQQREVMKGAGVLYKYIASMIDLSKIPEADRRYDLLIVDSETIWITEKWGVTNQQTHGQIMQEIQSHSASLKRWAHRYGSTVIITAQATSAFMGNEQVMIGDKISHVVKEIVKVSRIRSGGKTSLRTAEAWDSRVLREGTIIFEFKTNSVGVDIVKSIDVNKWLSIDVPKRYR